METPPRILIANADPAESATLSQMLTATGYASHICHCLDAVTSALGSASYLAVVLDLDTIGLDNRRIRFLTLTYPGVGFLCTSSRRYHPELQESLRSHIYACLSKPIDADELAYWIRCIGESGGKSVDPSGDG